MTRTLVFSGRNRRELLRDPLNVAFALGFPLVVMLLLTAIQRNVPVAIFHIEMIAPGMAVFGLSFISLFSGMLLAKDRSTSFLMRLCASPMTARDFIVGYALPLVPLGLLQSAICYAVAVALGLSLNVNILFALVTGLPTVLLYVAIGLLAGTVFTDKQVGGICGALLTNLSAWLSGTWFDLDLIGGGFKKVAYALPFAHAVDVGKASIAGAWAGIFPHLWWVLGYAVVLMGIAVVVFHHKMKNQTM